MGKEEIAIEDYCFQWLMDPYIHMDLHLDLMSGTALFDTQLRLFPLDLNTPIVRPKTKCSRYDCITPRKDEDSVG